MHNPWNESPWGGPEWRTHGGVVLISELEADPSSTSAQNFAGAHGGRGAVVEYLVDAGAASPSVDVLIVSGGASADWKDGAPTPGFHVHHLGHLAPGAKVTLTVAAAMARVRWCETVFC
jgi:hypothetical protein